MPRILDLQLDAEGSRAQAELTLTGVLAFAAPESPAGPCELHVAFRSNTDELLWSGSRWIGRGAQDTSGDDVAWSIATEGDDRIRFTLVAPNTLGVLTGGRIFDEDLGRDEVLAVVVTRDAAGNETSESVRSNLVQGRF